MEAGLSDTKVFLTGFMGSGKSTLGRPLAEALNLRFADLDEVIADRAGRSIADIFARGGESRFRALEAAALRSAQPGIVYALGGGALAREGNLRWALTHGIVLYLKVPVEELQRRLVADPVVRPLLRDEFGRRLPGPALREKIASLLAKRAPFYERAHITIIPAENHRALVHAAIRAVRAYAAESLNDRR